MLFLSVFTLGEAFDTYNLSQIVVTSLDNDGNGRVTLSEWFCKQHASTVEAEISYLAETYSHVIEDGVVTYEEFESVMPTEVQNLFDEFSTDGTMNETQFLQSIGAEMLNTNNQCVDGDIIITVEWFPKYYQASASCSSDITSPDQCSANTFDSTTFDANQMCCRCGGGSLSDETGSWSMANFNSTEIAGLSEADTVSWPDSGTYDFPRYYGLAHKMGDYNTVRWNLLRIQNFKVSVQDARNAFALHNLTQIDIHEYVLALESLYEDKERASTSRTCDSSDVVVRKVWEDAIRMRNGNDALNFVDVLSQEAQRDEFSYYCRIFEHVDDYFADAFYYGGTITYETFSDVYAGDFRDTQFTSVSTMDIDGFKEYVQSEWGNLLVDLNMTLTQEVFSANDLDTNDVLNIDEFSNAVAAVLYVYLLTSLTRTLTLTPTILDTQMTFEH